MLLASAWPGSLSAQSDSIHQELQELEQQHQGELAAAERPIHKSYLAELKKWRDRLNRREQDDLAKRLEAEIKLIEAKLTPNQNPRKTTPKPASVEGDFKDAKLAGKVRYLPDSKRLAGFNSERASAEIAVSGLVPKTTYTLELAYSSTENRRLEFAVAGKRFHPKILSSEGFDKAKSLNIGDLVASAKGLTITVTMPVFRSRDSIQLHHLRLIPKANG